LGLQGSPITENDLKTVFARKLIIMSGEKDIDPNDTSLANFPAAEAQGKTRFERAKFYFDIAQKQAEKLHIPIMWEYHIVPAIGHSEAGMAGPSAEALFNDI